MSGVRLFMPVPTARAVEQTPPDRDRVVDAARAVSLVVVVAGHSIMAVVAWVDGVPRLGNLLAAFPWTQALTWLFQVMPLFFVAGGAASTLSWQRHEARGGSYAAWLWARASRLLRPAWVYLVVMSVVATFVTVLAPQRVAEPLMLLVTQLLWFLGAYLLVTALTPLFRARTPAHGAAVAIALVTGCGLVDAARFFWGFPEVVGLVNFVLVWTVPAYLGSLRARGMTARYPRWVLCLVVVGALGLNATLIHLGPWPVSMVGMPGEPVSNMAPPSVVLAIHSVALAAVLTLASGPLARLLQRPAVWRPVTGVNLVAMTLYLWHLPVLITVTVVSHNLHLDRPIGLDAQGFPAPDGWGYAWGSVLFWSVYGLGVWAVVRLMWPFEHTALPWWDSPPRAAAPSPGPATWAAALGTAGVGVSTLVLSATGLAGFPTQVVSYAGLPLNSAAAITLLVASGALIRWAGAPRVATGGSEQPVGATGR
jgi:fucose 4-O-acetylase-like acetyltransferase